MTANPLPPDDNTPDDPLGIDPELIKELDAKSKEIVDEAVAAGNIGALLDPEQIFPSPGNPMGVARRLLKDWTHDGLTTLLHWRGAWMQWQITHWVEVEEGTIRAKVYSRLEKAVYLVTLKPEKKTQESTEKKTLADLAAPWLPNRRKVGDVMEAMKGCVHLNESVDTPSCLRAPHVQPANELVACTNGLLHVGTRKLLELTPAYFNRVSVPFNYDPDAPQPTRWLGFLDQVWPDDRDSTLALQEFFGYVISGRTDLQKILLMIGPPRSGRGTIARVLTALIGRGHTAAPTLASLATNFGLAPLLGKPLAIVGDARLGRGGKDSSAVVERLLSISGEDMLTIDRKFREQWTGKLPTRFVILSNELPRFGDASGAIAHRFIVLSMVESFLGKENTKLTGELLAELPGILRWALDGLDRLTRQSFTTPKSSDDAIRELEDLVSPVSAFVRDECERGPQYDVEAKKLYAAWKEWCEANGHRVTASHVFGGDLRAVIPGLRRFQPHGQSRHYAGLRLRSTARNGSVGVSGVSPVSAAIPETPETPETPSDLLQPLQESENGLGPQTHCRTCGTELRSQLQARGTCGPCYFEATGWAQ
jgi:putative DNA primase/helicase